MDMKLMKTQFFHESMARRVFFRIFLFASAISIIPIVHLLTTKRFTNFHLPNSNGCYTPLPRNNPDLPRGSYLFQGHFLNPVWINSLDSQHCRQNVNLTINIITELLNRHHLFNHSAQVLYAGESSSSAAAALRDLGFSGAVGVDLKKFGFKLHYLNCSFDFVLFRGMRFKLFSVSGFAVGEVERVLKSGGIGVVVSGGNSTRSAARVVGFLKSSCVLGSGYLNKFYMTVFMKESGNGSFSDEHRRRPVGCSTAVMNTTVLQISEHL